MSPTTALPVRNRHGAGGSLRAGQIVQTLKLNVRDLDRQLHVAKRLGCLSHGVKVIEQAPGLERHASQLAGDSLLNDRIVAAGAQQMADCDRAVTEIREVRRLQHQPKRADRRADYNDFTVDRSNRRRGALEHSMPVADRRLQRARHRRMILVVPDARNQRRRGGLCLEARLAAAGGEPGKRWLGFVGGQGRPLRGCPSGIPDGTRLTAALSSRLAAGMFPNPKGSTQMTQQATVTTRIPDLPFSWHFEPINPERFKRFMKLPRAERVVLAEQFAVNKAEMVEWASTHPHEIPRVNGEFFFIALFMGDLDD